MQKRDPVIKEYDDKKDSSLIKEVISKGIKNITPDLSELKKSNKKTNIRNKNRK